MSPMAVPMNTDPNVLSSAGTSGMRGSPAPAVGSLAMLVIAGEEGGAQHRSPQDSYMVVDAAFDQIRTRTHRRHSVRVRASCGVASGGKESHRSM